MVYNSEFEKTVTIHNWLRCIATVKQFTVNCKDKSNNDAILKKAVVLKNGNSNG